MEEAKIGFFEKYLTIWVLLCIAGGVIIGHFFIDSIHILTSFTYNQVNIPIAILIWLMIYPMMIQVDFDSLKNAAKDIKGLSLTIGVNWLIKPFTMALFAYVFFKWIFSSFISNDEAEQYIAGAILLGAAPCTAMVFVWSYLSGGNANYTLLQVAVNDLILLAAFVPIVQFLLGITSFIIPYEVLITSVIVFVCIPLVVGYLTQKILIKSKGKEWLDTVFLPNFKPLSIIALLSTLILLFAFQSKSILANPFHIVLIAIPLTIETYFIFFLSWKAGKMLNLPYPVCAPAAMIGASNFFELAVAVAIILFGLESGAALATVVGVLIEVPVMLSLVQIAKNRRY